MSQQRWSIAVAVGAQITAIRVFRVVMGDYQVVVQSGGEEAVEEFECNRWKFRENSQTVILQRGWCVEVERRTWNIMVSKSVLLLDGNCHVVVPFSSLSCQFISGRT